MKLSLRSINLNFGSRQILRELNFTFQTGITVLTGDNGSGKTSLLNIIAGQLKEYSGKITVDDCLPDLTRIAYCRQFMADAFFTATIEKEIRYTLAYSSSTRTENDIWNNLNGLGLSHADYANRSPFYINQSEQKLFSLALSLIKEFDILLLDETDSGLPFTGKKKLADFLKTISDKIIIVISHDLWFINQLNPPVLKLDKGGSFKYYSQAADFFQSLTTDPVTLNILISKDKLLQKLAQQTKSESLSC